MNVTPHQCSKAVTLLIQVKVLDASKYTSSVALKLSSSIRSWFVIVKNHQFLAVILKRPWIQPWSLKRLEICNMYILVFFKYIIDICFDFSESNFSHLTEGMFVFFMLQYCSELT